MPKRTLGGGRVLGSGEAINPAAPPPVPPKASTATDPARSALSPAPSTRSVSSQSQSSVPYNAGDSQDLRSRIFVENGVSSISRRAHASDARPTCPICNEEMVTLLQLNRHLDDEHRNLEDDRQDEVKDWFQIQVEKAKKFQPLAVLNQKLKGLDVFESNSNHLMSSSPPTARPTNVQAAEPPRVLDPEELVTRAHWQQRGLYDVCLEPMCEKRLTVTTGCINCRKCGKLFCEEHTMYQMKLSKSALHEPIRGVWCRVCETCYKSREGYNDHTGAERDHTDLFKKIRKPVVDRAFLEVSRLEKRLSRLTQLLVTLPLEQVQSGASKRWPISWQSDQRKTLEQSVVGWQEDTEVSRCPFCQQEFTTYTFRRHHCRTCGRVVCGDPATECSTEVGLDVAAAAKAESSPGSEKPSSEKINIDIRLCKDCRSTLFDRRDFDADLHREPSDLRSYKNLVQFERGIRLLLPRFQKLLAALQDPDNPPSPAQLSEASKVRKRLMDSFAQYDVAARRIRDLPTQSSSQAKLQKAIYHQATNFLHLHMLPLKTLPKILKHATPHGRHSDIALNGSPAPRGGQGNAFGYNGSHPAAAAASTSTTSITSDNSSAISALETEEKALRDRLIVLEEQKFFVSEMMADANRRRKLDEASALSQNVRDLDCEIDRVNGMLGRLDFEGVYLGASNNEDGAGSPNASTTTLTHDDRNDDKSISSNGTPRLRRD